MTKIGAKVVCADEYMLEEYAPNKYLQTFAQLEAGMEGKIAYFLEDNEIVIDFYGTKVICTPEDFEDGTFFLPSEETATEAKLRQASSKPSLKLLK